ncbi:ELWxxDGT repeat protein [Hyalangium versicolor]|uniref:ELWxxDGT repeat protein n=1 Tax=Hyalangium versicolor TaxID=2861190 RepID=UPI001CC90150|nr:ELWxxDGT repeat protein [Hyalangium versicolor]
MNGHGSLTCILAWVCVAACADPSPAREAPHSQTAALVAPSGALGQARLVADINTSAREVLSSNPEDFIALGDTLVFSVQGKLWRSDGTEAGTVPLRGLSVPPVDPGRPSRVLLGTALYFVASDGQSGEELWRTDGTEAGTVLVKDLFPGPGSSRPRELTNIQGTLYFTTAPFADGAAYPMSIWKSDGTETGTVLVKTFPDVFTSAFLDFTAARGTVFFIGYERGFYSSLCKTDGTEKGTVLVKDITPNWAPTPSMLHLTEAGGLLYFSFNDGSGPQLWRSDGSTNGTVKLRDVWPGFTGQMPSDLIQVGGLLFFVADGPSGRELWRTDGSAQGTWLIQDLRPGPQGSKPADLTDWNGTLYFSADDGSGRELWKTDGSPEGTVKVTSLRPSGGANPTLLKVFQDRLYFTATLPESGTELWRTDGTAAGTELVREVKPGPEGANPRSLTVVGGTLYFSANDGVTGAELWKTDGSAERTVLVKDLLVGLAHASPTNMFAYQDRLYFSAEDGLHGSELWTSDGTEAGTFMLKDVLPGPEGSRPYSFWSTGKPLYFATTLTPNLPWFWMSDGTTAGTLPALDDDAISQSLQLNQGLRVGEQRWILEKAEPSTGLEPYVSDGTKEGTVLLADISPGAVSSRPASFASEGGPIYFVANDARWGHAFWRTDGTPGGTVSIDDSIGYPRNKYLAPEQLAVLNGSLYFVAWDERDHGAIWRTDGTVSSTFLVKDLVPTLGGSGVFSPFSRNNGLLFFIGNSVNAEGLLRRNLWRTDGTEAGTFPVTDIRRYSLLSMSNLLEREGLMLLIVEDFDTRERILWQSDGTVAGTYPVPLSVLPPGSKLALPSLARLGDELYFSANDGVHGFELWKAPIVPPAGRAPGVLRCPKNVLGSSEGAAGALVTWPEATAADGSPFPSPVSYSVAPGSRFPAGTTLVTATADVDSRLASCSFLVTVADVEPPSVSCPPDQSAQASGSKGAEVFFPSAQATDALGPVSLVATPASGSWFPVGTTEVEVIATDASHNTARCTLQVTVTALPPSEPPSEPPDDPQPPPDNPQAPPPGKTVLDCSSTGSTLWTRGTWAILLLVLCMRRRGSGLKGMSHRS